MKTLIRILLLTFAVAAFAEPPQYILVLKKATEEPDLASYGATKETQWMDRIVVRVPDEAFERLEADPRVAYLQRVIQPGETLPDVPRRHDRVAMNATLPEPESDATTNPSWSSGNYKYDASNNIINIGNDYYLYDRLNRLTRATFNGSAGTYDIYSYDSFGNLYERGTTLGGSYSVSTMQVSGSDNKLQNAGYDGVGNLTSGGGTPWSFKWDSFRMMMEQSGNSGLQYYYVYTADDQRIGVRNNAQGVWKWTARDLGGLVIREYEASSSSSAWLWREDFVHRDSFIAASVRETAEGGRRQYHLDHLGTPRLVTNANGQAVSRHDYTPFGLEITSIRQEQARGYSREAPLRFTGHERDFNTGTGGENTDYTDYMHARYYRPGQARFLSVDAGQPDVRKPQTWNRYSYAHNNPLRYVDPDGNIPVETAIDVVSFGASVYSLITAPSWANLGYAAWDAASIFLPYVPGSWIAKVGKYGYKGLKAAGIVKQLDVAETAVNNTLLREGVALLGQGDDSVRALLGMKKGEKAADFVGVTKDGTFKIVEAKGTDMASAVEQIKSTATALKPHTEGAEITAEIIIRAESNLNNLGQYAIVDGYLWKFDVNTLEWTQEFVEGMPIAVRQIGTKGR